MSTLSALGARALPTPTFPAATQQYGKTGRSHTASAAGNGGNSTGDGSVSLSDDSILQNRAATLGSATVDYAQNLLSSFTQQVFGDASKGETVSFDSISLDTSSAFAESAQQTSGANGGSSAAAGLSDSSHFIGKGTITTSDGRSFDFEIEVQYNDKIEVGASRGNADGTDTAGATSPDTSGDSTATAPVQSGAQSANSTGTPASGLSGTGAGTGGLPTVQLPNLDFAGGLADLFQLIGRQIQSGSDSSGSSSTGDASGSGNSAGATDPFKALSLRLLKLVDAGSDSDLYTPSTPASTAAKALANTYGTPATTASGAAAAGPAGSAAAIATTPAAAGTTDTSAASTATPVTAPAATTTTPATAAA